MFFHSLWMVYALTRLSKGSPQSGQETVWGPCACALFEEGENWESSTVKNSHSMSVMSNVLNSMSRGYVVGCEANAETLKCDLGPEDLKEMRTPQCGGLLYLGVWTVSMHLAAPGGGILVASQSPCFGFSCRVIWGHWGHITISRGDAKIIWCL